MVGKPDAKDPAAGRAGAGCWDGSRGTSAPRVGNHLPQLSFSVVTRLNTGLPGFESTWSATK